MSFHFTWLYIMTYLNACRLKIHHYYGVHYYTSHLCSPVCNNSDVRIIGDESNLRIWGEAQICHQHHWGAVCNDNWNLEDARVFCRQLGYSPWGKFKLLF